MPVLKQFVETKPYEKDLAKRGCDLGSREGRQVMSWREPQCLKFSPAPLELAPRELHDFGEN